MAGEAQTQVRVPTYRKRTVGPLMWSVSSEGVRWWRIKFERTGRSGFTLGFFVHRHHIWKWELYGRIWWRGERKWDGFKSGRLRRA